MKIKLPDIVTMSEFGYLEHFILEIFFVFIPWKLHISD